MTRNELVNLVRRLAVPSGVLAIVLVVVGVATSMLYSRLGAINERLSDLERRNAQAIRTTQRLSDGLDFIRAHLGAYEDLRQAQFTAPHDRLAAGERIENIASRLSLASVRYTFRAKTAAVIPAKADDPKAKLEATPLTVKIQSAFDRRIFRFIDALGDALPGYVVLKGGSMSRAASPGLPKLDETATAASPPSIVKAELQLAWVRLNPSLGEDGDA